MVVSVNSVNSSNRTQNVAQGQSLRNNPVVLDAIVKTQQKTSGSAAPVNTALAVPQSAKTGGTSGVKLPRGSLVDVLA